MKGLATVGPYTAMLLLDRTKFKWLGWSKFEEEEREQLDKIRNGSLTRTPVIFVNGVNLLTQLSQSEEDFSSFKFLIFDTAVNLNNAGVNILDMQQDNDKNWVRKEVTRTLLNSALEEEVANEVGVVRTIGTSRLRAKGSKLEDTLDSLTMHLPEKKASSLRRLICNCIVGLNTYTFVQDFLEKKQVKRADAILKFLKSNVSDRLAAAYHEVYFNKTLPQKAAKINNIGVKSLQYLCKIVTLAVPENKFKIQPLVTVKTCKDTVKG